jgi:hypothetical protein
MYKDRKLEQVMSETERYGLVLGLAETNIYRNRELKYSGKSEADRRAQRVGIVLSKSDMQQPTTINKAYEHGQKDDIVTIMSDLNEKVEDQHETLDLKQMTGNKLWQEPYFST